MRASLFARRGGASGWLLVVVAALAALAFVLWTAPRWLVPRFAAHSPRCLYTVPTPERVVALTLDDGPDATHTRALLDLLRAHDARATFFLVSSRVPGNEALVKTMVAEGHELGNHLTRDEASIRLSPHAFAAGVAEAGRVLGDFGTVSWLRPGSGWYNDSMLDTIERAGYQCALGSVYPYDAHLPWPDLSTSYVLANVRPGAVIVLHEGGERSRRTIETLRRVLPELRARGYQVVTLSELATLRR
jgi:peptidoglycan/xylan/chitin deacetylase (PgdA/CDA1 family)